jgi:hypothetical protein
MALTARGQIGCCCEHFEWFAVHSALYLLLKSEQGEMGGRGIWILHNYWADGGKVPKIWWQLAVTRPHHLSKGANYNTKGRFL